ncbi:DUF3618 domain-containing protein [Gordonia sp. HY002]|uniref:DUF3618 domain-containing protein n=1 Tax=Gordonia zhenghanii TaxID=2911516 RepID=UPI001EF0712C|nr:DUF3618 domain-containing protein [Gordonia zhenghanii]MCF8569398.1 DUF3618 domain-containing protein [Gordonia zhenghanii]MCF8603597.1 DUF3618 domain-containing protein [Gordonia zhenghanii]
MAGDTERIEKDIAQAREELAKTLDQLAVKGNPQRLAGEAKTKAMAVVQKPAVKYGAAGVGALVVAVIVKIFR